MSDAQKQALIDFVTNPFFGPSVAVCAVTALIALILNTNATYKILTRQDGRWHFDKVAFRKFDWKLEGQLLNPRPSKKQVRTFLERKRLEEDIFRTKEIIQGYVMDYEDR